MRRKILRIVILLMFVSYVFIFDPNKVFAMECRDFTNLEGNPISSLENGTVCGVTCQDEQKNDMYFLNEETIDIVEESNIPLTTDVGDNDELTHIATVDKNLTYEGQWTTGSEEEQYTFSVDFSEMDKAVICLVRTGLNNTEVTLYNPNGDSVTKLTTSDFQAKKWFYIEKPSVDSSIIEYSITVKPLKYNKNKSSNYRIMIGDKSKAEFLMGGIENAVELDTYYEADGNFQSATYLPNHDSYYYKITNWGSSNILTILLKNNNIRFRLWNNDIQVLDSNDSSVKSTIHRTKFVGNAWTCAEKIDLSKLLTGKGPYFIEIYNLQETSSDDLISSNFLTAFGNPVMCYKSTKVVPGNTITINSNRFTESTFNVSSSNIPQTAKVDSISYGGTAGSSIQYFRAMPPNGTWKNGSSFSSGINFAYKKDSRFNYDVRGDWQVAYRASNASKNNRITPYYTISYYYEYGD